MALTDNRLDWIKRGALLSVGAFPLTFLAVLLAILVT